MTTGPLEREFAQAYAALGRLVTGGTIVCSYCNASRPAVHRKGCPVIPVLAALSSIERHAQEQGELLERLLDYGASGYQEALARRSAWVSSQPGEETNG